jgi:hypothetical protein
MVHSFSKYISLRNCGDNAGEHGLCFCLVHSLGDLMHINKQYFIEPKEHYNNTTESIFTDRHVRTGAGFEDEE